MTLGITGLWPYGYGNGYIPMALSAGSTLFAAPLTGAAQSAPLVFAPLTLAAGSRVPLMTGGEAGTGAGAGCQVSTVPGAGVQTPGMWPGTWGQTPGAWGQTPTEPGMGPMSTQAQLVHLLRMIESSFVLDEVLHAFLADASKRPEMARMPALAMMARHSQQSLHARMAAAGFLRRALAGEMTREVMAGVAEQMRTYNRELSHALHHSQGLAEQPQAAQVPELRVIQNVMEYKVHAHRLLGQQLQMTMGITLEPAAAPIGTSAETPEAQ